MERSMDGLKQRLYETLKNGIDYSNAAATEGCAVAKEYAEFINSTVVKNIEEAESENV